MGTLQRIDNRFAEVHAEVDQQFVKVGQQFGEVRRHFDSIDERFDQVDVRLAHIDVCLAHVGDRLDDIEDRLDEGVETRFDEFMAVSTSEPKRPVSPTFAGDETDAHP